MQNNNGKINIVVIIAIVFVVVAGAWFFISKKQTSNILSQTEIQSDSQYIHTDNVRILYPIIGQKIEIGSKVVVKYEVLRDIPPYTENPDEFQITIIAGSGCGESFTFKKPKGIYTFECKNLGEGEIGPLSFNVVQRAYSIEGKPIFASGDVIITAPSNSRPVEIIPGGSVNFDGSLNVHVPVKNEPDEHVALSSLHPSVKFSDGETYYITFTDFTYSFDDPTLVRFYPADAKVPVFIGNRIGKTTLHLEYQGIKKDVSITTVPDSTTPEDPISYEKVYDMTVAQFKAMCSQKNGTYHEDTTNVGYNTNTSTWNDTIYCESPSGNYWSKGNVVQK